MARYIKAAECAKMISEKLNIPIYNLVYVFAEIPAADVAPKSEVAREIFEEIETLLCRSVYPRVNANGTITPITSKDWHIRCDDYDAIKKKYTEDKE